MQVQIPSYFDKTRTGSRSFSAPGGRTNVISDAYNIS